MSGGFFTENKEKGRQLLWLHYEKKAPACRVGSILKLGKPGRFMTVPFMSTLQSLYPETEAKKAV